MPDKEAVIETGDQKATPSRAGGSELSALNDLLRLMNNPAITGAEVPASEKPVAVRPMLPVKSAAPLIPEAPKNALPLKLEPEPEPASQDKPAEPIRNIENDTPQQKPLLVLTGRAGVGKSWLQAQVKSRNVVANVMEAADFRALRASRAELWHVMASDATLARRRPPGAAVRPANQLAAALDIDVNARLAKLAPGAKLRAVWNDPNVVAPSGTYSVAEFLAKVA